MLVCMACIHVQTVIFLPRHWLNFSMSCMLHDIIITNLGVACNARAESFTEAVASVASMVATPLTKHKFHTRGATGVSSAPIIMTPLLPHAL